MIGLGVRLLLHTGQRVMEVLGASWSEFTFGLGGPDFDITKPGWTVVDHEAHEAKRKVVANWIIPGSRSKRKRDHLVPLPPTTVEVLLKAHGISRERALAGKLPKGHICPDVPTVCRNDWSEPFRERCAKRGVARWQLRDLRRTAATGIASHGATDEIVARVIGHAIPGVPRVTGVYQRFERPSEVRDALELWAADIELQDTPKHSTRQPRRPSRPYSSPQTQTGPDPSREESGPCPSGCLRAPWGHAARRLALFCHGVRLGSLGASLQLDNLRDGVATRPQVQHAPHVGRTRQRLQLAAGCRPRS